MFFPPRPKKLFQIRSKSKPILTPILNKSINQFSGTTSIPQTPLTKPKTVVKLPALKRVTKTPSKSTIQPSTALGSPKTKPRQHYLASKNWLLTPSQT